MISVLLIYTTVVTVTAQTNLTPYGITQSSSLSNDTVKGKPENAVYPPISNQYSLDNCSSTGLAVSGISATWWLFKFSLDTAYITDIIIYYREDYANRMNGSKLYVTNTSTIPPVGYLCYEDPFSPRGPYPNITQTIPCNQLGKYVIYYDNNGSDEASNIFLPVVELCYVAINGPVCYKPDLVNFTTSCAPEVYQVFPTSGPVNGGTVLTISGNYLGNVNDSISIDIGGVRCTNLTVQTPYTTLTCIIGKTNATNTMGVLVLVNANNYSDLNTVFFTFKEPKITYFSPKKGILSGNTTVTIHGQNIGFEGQNRYNISFCDDKVCIKCSEYQKTPSSQNNYIKCKTGISTMSRNMNRLKVVIDDLTVLTLNETFQYLPDPTFNISTEIPKALQSGGVTFTIRGEGFNNVGVITVDRVVKPCDVPDDTSTECETPPRLQNQHNNQTIEVHFDGVTIQVTIEYVDDPAFENFTDVYQYDKQSSIEIKVNVIKIKVDIGDLQYKTETTTENSNTFVMVVGILAAGVVVTIIIGISAVLVLRRKKTKAANEFKMELIAKAEMIQQARREGLSERIENLRGEDGDPYTEPDESVYDEIHSDEENANDGYDELGQRSPKNPYNQLQQKRDYNPSQDEINADDELQTNKQSDYLNICEGYEKQISRNDPLFINQLQQVLKTKITNKS
ncbi:PLXNB [Mytilus edulis]|uniref:PLXNB n=1 Tax=Mytilus edulis TaxID=6550 RepID=A0A8S3PUD4_MYTED|nr:PLXNB [Mytilus edulis]